MATVPDDRHAFIVRLWLEAHATRGEASQWRGQVVHVPSGARRYVQEWDEVQAFVDTYLRRTTPTMGLGSSRDVPAP